MELPDWLTDPAVVAVLASLATYFATAGRPVIAAVLKAAVAFLSKQKPQPTPEPVFSEFDTQCAVLKCIRHKFSEQDDATARTQNLDLCDKLDDALETINTEKA